MITTKELNNIEKMCNIFLDKVLSEKILEAHSNGDNRVLIKPLSLLEANKPLEFYKNALGKIYNGPEADKAGKYLWNKIEQAGYNFEIVNIPLQTMCGYIFDYDETGRIEFRHTDGCTDKRIDIGLRQGNCNKVQVCNVYITWGDKVKVNLSKGKTGIGDS